MNFIFRILAKARPPRELIGPPDPVSNIRPIIISGRHPRQGNETHPYSLAEFDCKDDADLQWRIERERLNIFNHAFWSDSNTRFIRGKQHVLERFHGQQPTAKDKEAALSEFYTSWSVKERSRQAAYTDEWNRRNLAIINLAIRRQLRIWGDSFRSRIL